MEGFITSAAAIFNTVVAQLPTIGTTIMNDPILLTFTAVPLVGLGVGLFRRLLNIN